MKQWIKDFSLDMTDKSLLIGSVISMVFFSFCLWNEELIINKFVPVQKGQIEIGLIKSVENDVRRKFDKSITWYSTKERETVFEGDSIFTGKNSDSVIQLSNGLDLKISENSLIVLSQKNDELTLDLKLGHIVAGGNNQKTKKLTLIQGQKKAIVSLNQKGQVQLTKNDQGDLNIDGKNGVELNLDGKVERLDDKSRIKIDKNSLVEKQSFDIGLIYPESRSDVWLEESNSIKFSWKNSEKKISKYQLLISENSDMSQAKKWDNIKGLSKEVNHLKANKKYYWKVEALVGNDIVGKSKIAQFNVFNKAKIQLLEPALGQTFSIPGQEQNVLFKWSKVTKIEDYVMEVYQDQQLTNKIFDINLQRNLILRKLALGTYFWRVKPKYKNVSFLWSELGHFSISPPTKKELELDSLFVENLKPELEKTLEPPVQVDFAKFDGDYLEGDYVLDFDHSKLSRKIAEHKKAISNPPHFKWKPNSGEVVLQISKDPEFGQNQTQQLTVTNHWQWGGVQPGPYFWRVIGQESHQVIDKDFEKPKKLNVLLPTPLVKKQYELVAKVKKVQELLEPGPAVSIDWKGVPMAHRYLALVDKDRDFKESKKQKTSQKSQLQWEFEKEGTYYFKVAAVDSAQRPISRYSATAKVKFKKELILPPPKLTFPEKGMSVVSFGGDEFEPILFTWTENKEVEGYVVQMATDKHFKKTIGDFKVQEANYFLNEKPKYDKIYWRVRSYYKKFNSPWSKPRYFSFTTSQ